MRLRGSGPAADGTNPTAARFCERGRKPAEPPRPPRPPVLRCAVPPGPPGPPPRLPIWLMHARTLVRSSGVTAHPPVDAARLLAMRSWHSLLIVEPPERPPPSRL